MPDVRALFADYAAYHQTKGNKAFHRVGVPLIMLTLIGMLTRVTLWRSGGMAVDAAELLIVAAEIYYLAVEWRLALAMVVVCVAFYFAGAAIPLWLNAVLFVLGWVFQFVGHIVYEHRQPAFFRNFVHLLVAPLWILNGIIPMVSERERSA